MEQKKRTSWFYVGRALEDPSAIQADKLLWAKDMLKYSMILTDILSVPASESDILQLHKAQKEEKEEPEDFEALP